MSNRECKLGPLIDCALRQVAYNYTRLLQPPQLLLCSVCVCNEARRYAGRSLNKVNRPPRTPALHPTRFPRSLAPSAPRREEVGRKLSAKGLETTSRYITTHQSRLRGDGVSVALAALVHRGYPLLLPSGTDASSLLLLLLLLATSLRRVSRGNPATKTVEGEWMAK